MIMNGMYIWKRKWYYKMTKDKLQEEAGDRCYHVNKVQNNTICCICGKSINNKLDFNNPYPIKKEGECCNECNLQIVVPARLKRREVDE